MKFQSLVSQLGKPVNPAEALANRSSKWVAKHFNVSRRTAQRWKAGSQQPAERGNRRESVMKSADAETRRKVAADAIREAQAIHMGRTEVIDKSPKGKARKQGRNYRNPGTVRPDPEALARAADALESGDVERAEKLLSDAVLRSPGKSYGDALDVLDWPADFHTI